jgi:glycosyltransferase 2 family protein
MLRPAPLGAATLLSVISWGMEGAAFWLILGALGGQGATLQKAEFLFSMTTIFGAISFLPGGLGMTEGTMIGGLLWMGIFKERGPAIAATYLIRLVTLWYGVGVGFVALLSYPRQVERAAEQALEDQ